MPVFTRSIHLPVTAEVLYKWHASDGAFARLAPVGTQIVASQGPFETRRVTIKPHPLAPAMVAQHTDAVPGRQFVDYMVRSPFAHWRHTHRFEPRPDGTSTLIDSIDWELPLPPLGRWVAGWLVDRMLDKMFRIRHRTTLEDLMQHNRWADRPRQIVAITGASGLVGSALQAYLSTAGHQVRVLVRRAAKTPQEIQWDPRAGTVDLAALEGVTAVIHLAGENIGAGRWTAERKAVILSSRVQGTATIAKAVANLKTPPQVLISASATGWYGDVPEAGCDETAPVGRGFLASVCQQWEAAAQPARDAGIRVVFPRFAAIVAPGGGMLDKLLLPAKLGLSGPVGSGQQWLPWIGLQDVLGILEQMLFDDRLSGPVNCVAPQLVRQVEFARALGKVLHRPAVAPLPALAVKLMLGELGEALLLQGAKVVPAKLQQVGYPFVHPDLQTALAAVLGLATPSPPG